MWLKVNEENQTLDIIKLQHGYLPE